MKERLALLEHPLECSELDVRRLQALHATSERVQEDYKKEQRTKSTKEKLETPVAKLYSGALEIAGGFYGPVDWAPRSRWDILRLAGEMPNTVPWDRIFSIPQMGFGRKHFHPLGCRAAFKPRAPGKVQSFYLCICERLRFSFGTELRFKSC